MFVGWFGPMGVGALYYALKATEQLSPDNLVKQHLFGIISWIVFTSTFVHGTAAITYSSLTSGITIPFFLLGSSLHPSLHPKFLVQDRNDTPDETTSLLHDAEEGEPLHEDELQRLLSSEESTSAELSSSQRNALLNEDSGLKGWGRGKINVYNQGSNLVICDEHGELSIAAVLMGQATSRSGELMGRKGSRRVLKMYDILGRATRQDGILRHVRVPPVDTRRRVWVSFPQSATVGSFQTRC